VDERVFQPPKSGQLASYRRLDCLELTVNHDDNQVYAPGPGWVRMVQPGNSDLAPVAGGNRTTSGAAPRAGKPASEEWKLTLIHYSRLMTADNKNRTATFWGDGGDVKVLHVPWDKTQATKEINFDKTVDKMPPGGLYLRCDRLTVYSRLDNTRKGQELDAIGRVNVKARDAKGQEFWGNADLVHFDEEKDQVIFEGVEGSKVRLYLREAPGAPPKPLVGKKIIYLRSKGEFNADGVTSIQGSN
jgi:hypothetical protein